MSFHEVQFPTEISWGAKGGPGFMTRILETASGYEQRIQEWSIARARYEVGHMIKSNDELHELLTFFYARRGRLHGFRFKDFGDYRASNTGDPVDCSPDEGDASETEFQLIKTYSDSGNSYVRTIKKPVNNSTLRVYVNDVLQTLTTHYTIDYSTGLITFVSPPGNGLSVQAYFEFDVPCRFDIDNVDAVLAQFNNNEWPSIPIVEIRV